MSTLDHEHGTYAGMLTHYRRRTPVCEPCKAAHNDYQRAWRIRNGRVDRLSVSVDTLRRIARLYPLTDEILADDLGHAVANALCEQPS